MGEKNFSLDVCAVDKDGNMYEIDCESIEIEFCDDLKDTENLDNAFKGACGTFKLKKEYELKLLKMICKLDPFVDDKFIRKYKYLKRCYNRDLLYKKNKK